MIPSKDMVIVHRVDTNPPSWDAKTVSDTANHEVVSKAQFIHLLQLILDANAGHS